MVSSVISAIENCGVIIHNNESLLIECNCVGNACDRMGSKSTLVEHKTTLLKTECEHRMETKLPFLTPVKLTSNEGKEQRWVERVKRTPKINPNRFIANIKYREY